MEIIRFKSLSKKYEMLDSFVRLNNAIAEFASGRRFVFMQNDGNYGDALIRYGTLKFFDEFKYSFVERDMSTKTGKVKCVLDSVLDRNRRLVFIYSGSGAWSEYTTVGNKNVVRQLRLGSSVIVLPSTFQVYDKRQMESRDVCAFSREDESYKCDLVNSVKCHDMAFFLSVMNSESLFLHREAPTKKLGILFRTDNEVAAGHEFNRLDTNEDISSCGRSFSNIDHFFRKINVFEAILTDRLHVAIGGIMLGKRVYLYGNSYFKNKSIYDSSIKDFFDDAYFLESIADVKEVISMYS